MTNKAPFINKLQPEFLDEKIPRALGLNSSSLKNSCPAEIKFSCITSLALAAVACRSHRDRLNDSVNPESALVDGRRRGSVATAASGFPVIYKAFAFTMQKGLCGVLPGSYWLWILHLRTFWVGVLYHKFKETGSVHIISKRKYAANANSNCETISDVTRQTRGLRMPLLVSLLCVKSNCLSTYVT